EGLARSESLFRGVVQSSPDLIAIVSPDRSLRYLSPSIRPMLGLDPEALLGRAVVDMLHPEDGRLLSQMLDVIEAGKALPDALECRVRHRDGSWCHVEVTANRIAATRGDDGADQGRPEGFAMSIRDVTRRKEMEAEITFRAFHDSLTQLANRTLFTDRIERAVARSQPGRTQVAVAFIDLDDFKEVNDSFGHSVGDELLVTVAGRLRSCLRNVDTAARLGGDEFALLLEDVANPEEALAIVRRAMEVLRRPFRLGGRDVSVRASVGVALGSREQFTPDELLRNADVAMYAAKAGGKGRYEVFDPATHDGSGRRLELRIDLQGGIDRREFFLVFEPIALLASERIAGMEALVRWNHPQRGLMTPEEFIPLAEESGLIVPLGRWIIDEACHQAKGWYDDRDGIQPPFVAINLSARQLHDPELIHDLEASLDRSGLPPACVTLEVTESVLMHDVDDTLQTLRALKALGVRLAIDDFGTGYSSFSYLRRFPVDILKVDRAFIENLQNGPEDSAVARAIVKLAQTLKLQTVAEGISNPEQLQLLRDWGCEFGQGYHFSRPMSPQAVQRVLRDRTGAAALAAATASSVFAAQRLAVPAGAEL
ncbi:MAG TPA: EAL domain-containing protein, partial [Egibacteraceae bacterium]|nr:EAL domain-containing protein [Egibacteraceae bacterium]